jgi:hypothetical protein
VFLYICYQVGNLVSPLLLSADDGFYFISCLVFRSFERARCVLELELFWLYDGALVVRTFTHSASRFAGTVFFIIRWWDPVTFSHHSRDVNGPWPAWPLLDNDRTLWTWLFVVPLLCYSLWQCMYFLIVNGLRRQRMLNDPDIMTSYR